METEEVAPKEQTVKCLTAKVSPPSFRKSKSWLGPNSKPILISTTPLKLSPNWAFPEPDAVVATITGEDLKTSKIVVIQSTMVPIQLPRTVHLHW